MRRRIAGLLSLVLMIPLVDSGRGPQAQIEGISPSAETVRSLIMNNWSDTLTIHYARELFKADSRLFGPYMSALHGADDWTTNQIDGASSFIDAEVDGNGDATGPERPPSLCEASGEVIGDNGPAEPDAPLSFDTLMCFDEGGVLNVEYLRETEHGLPIQIVKSYAMPPDRPFVVARYRLTNNLPADDEQDVSVRLAELVDVNNKAAPDHEESSDPLSGSGLNQPSGDEPINDVQADWDADLGAWIVDMSAANGTFLVFGAFQEMERHRVFAPLADDAFFGEAIEPEASLIDQPDLPANSESLTAPDLGMSMWAETSVGPGESQDYAFFYAVASSHEEAQEVAQQAREPDSPEVWFEETRAAYQAWLDDARPVETPDPGMQEAYIKALITAKQSQQPEFGGFVAATNPAYGFRVWARDSAVTAMGLAAAGRLEEAMKYYRWMASVQEDGGREEFPAGTWFTVYSYWHEKFPISFVEPEHDSLGLFMVGVFHTWRLLSEQDPDAATEFLTSALDGPDGAPGSVYEAVIRSADFIADGINENDFGPADFSIWEEELAWNTFTQATYVSGLEAAGHLAEEQDEADRAAAWREAAGRIRQAIDRPASATPCPGLWNDSEGRWNRATRPDCTPDDRLDASSDLLWVSGVVDADDPRVLTQRDQVLTRLVPGDEDIIGVTRYEGDPFYHSAPFSPGGRFEATAAMPSWPQMDMYMAMLEHWLGMDEIAQDRLEWYARSTNAGYMPPGEAVDWPTDRPLPSTAAEPVTGMWYALGLLNFLDEFDPRLPPAEEAETGAWGTASTGQTADSP